jgi:hypothetical protein
VTKLSYVVQDAAEYGRLPDKLRVTWRVGYGSVTSRTGPLPAGFRSALQEGVASSCGSSSATHISPADEGGSPIAITEGGGRPGARQSTHNSEPCVAALVDSALALLLTEAKTATGITRFAVGVCFRADTGKAAHIHTRHITSFLNAPKVARPSKAALGPYAECREQPSIPGQDSYTREHEGGRGRLPADTSNQFPSETTGEDRKVVSKRMERHMEHATPGQDSGRVKTQALVAQLSSANMEGLSQGLSPEEVADLELALRLQAEEVRQARAPVRGSVQGNSLSCPSGVAPRKRGPMDAFVIVTGRANDGNDQV